MKTNLEILNFQILSQSELEQVNGGKWIPNQDGELIWIGD